jgi:hypothetical protein
MVAIATAWHIWRVQRLTDSIQFGESIVAGTGFSDDLRADARKLITRCTKRRERHLKALSEHGYKFEEALSMKTGALLKGALLVSSCMIALVVFIVLANWAAQHIPPSKGVQAARAEYTAQIRTEPLVTNEEPGIHMTVESEPQKFSADGRVMIMRGADSKGWMSIVFFYTSSDDVGSGAICPVPHIGDTIEVEKKTFTADQEWNAPPSDYTRPRADILWAVPKCR